ncbi:polysaccharide deacetylase family protein [Bacteroidales bacterium OttesenSCG-928-L03]|nr:polysaccharide deacetylase family protein [Bacteroidales bacterium OttesenSCG-928-L03]
MYLNPVIDRWAYRLKAEWERRGVSPATFALRKYRYISTFDIDHPYLYQNKTWVKTLGGLARDILRLRGKVVAQRLSVLARLSEDPYFQALQDIEQVHKEQGVPYSLFILMGEKTRYDRHTRRTPKDYYAYLKGLQDVTLGLHPSYNTLADLGLLRKEKAELEEVLGRTITSSRQHFLRMRVPDAYRNLLQAGIKEDYTLTFAQAPGFRAGTAIPFRFYDLEKDKATDLVLHPTAYMDSTFVFDKEHSPEAILSRMKGLIDEVKLSGGDCVALWHNSNLAGSKTENPWVSVFEESMKYGLLQENN